ncbi:hypothetical protein E3P81_01887 [Wallemia ichthyophaga]|nr:hypothetical protein E3P97_01886 [Wallemia ichthyophaga]TIB29414.1 hypothetical protein E3P85_03167 [Wallemia ichthyophaga]TIB47069.1 hypothetical protein E3P82_01863 [Wallemia ichthyophaga]TIB51346.1 hypothetical protein E3P81_01887 [Wallemia ichthyophaga]TIB54024.1 hypothetical protein E3P80_01864 [Wallemia ichthyophaga]
MPLNKGLSFSRNLPNQPPKIKRDRTLNDNSDAFKFNAWDNVPRPENEFDIVKPHIDFHQLHRADEEKVDKLNDNPSSYWNDFYKTHQSSFFKDRQWLGLEFPDLLNLVANQQPSTLLELGCGVGNSLFPILDSNQNSNLHLHGCDYSNEAIDIVKQHPTYLNPPNGSINASVWDLSNSSPSELPLPPNSANYILMIFVLSALHPDQFDTALNNIHTMLKPGGKVLFRDYGRYDLAQIRMKKQRLLQDHFYCRGDGTRVYFFELDELDQLFKKHGFDVQHSDTDRRLIINRKEEKKMYRVWQQATYTK